MPAHPLLPLEWDNVVEILNAGWISLLWMRFRNDGTPDGTPFDSLCSLRASSPMLIRIYESKLPGSRPTLDLLLSSNRIISQLIRFQVKKVRIVLLHSMM